MHGIAYLSDATRPYTAADLDALLLEARAFNAQAGVTGVLFFHAGRFFQYFEGEADSVHRVYDRIRAATSHAIARDLFDGPVPRRHFDAWHMGFCDAPQSAIQELANADWDAALPVTREDYVAAPALKLALYYWNKWSSESGAVR